MNIKKKILLILTTAALAQASFAQQKAKVIPEVSLKTETITTRSAHSRPQTTSFQQSELQDSPSVNLSDLLLQQQSTIRLTNNSGDTSQTALSIRGFGDNAGQNSLILIDGFPLTNASLLAPNFNSIPLSDIERIDIYQGSKGTLWGNQAVGGVMNIITRHPEKFFANSIVSAGSYQSYYINVIAAQKFKHGIFLKMLGVLARTNQFRAHNAMNGNNIAVQAGVDDAAGTTSINLQSYQNTTHFPGGLTQQQMQENPQQATNFSNYSQYRTNLLQLLNKHAFSDDWLLETRLSQQSTQGNGRVFLDFTMQDATFSIDPRLTGHWNNQKIILGYDGQIDRYQLDNAKVHARTRTTQNDLYVQLSSPMTTKLDVILGARKAWQNNTINTVPGLNEVFVSEQGFNYHPSRYFSWYIRRDGNFSFPKANAQVSAQNAQTRLNAQTGASYETGLQWLHKKSTLQLNLYRLDLHNEIAFNPEQTAAQPFGAWNNLDATRRYGVTAAEAYKLTEKINLNAQLNFVHARFVGGTYADNIIPSVPAITGNAGIDYSFHDDWQVKYFLTYTGTRYASNDLQNTGAKLGSYWLNNAALQYEKKAYIVSVEVMNLFNQSYAGYAYYDASSRANTYYPAAGRNLLLTLKVNIE